jgi:hypothetical protein
MKTRKEFIDDNIEDVKIFLDMENPNVDAESLCRFIYVIYKEAYKEGKIQK